MATNDEDAAAVLGFWFGEVSPDKRFSADPVLDGDYWRALRQTTRDGPGERGRGLARYS
jgi:hypothetical protein